MKKIVVCEDDALFLDKMVRKIESSYKKEKSNIHLAKYTLALSWQQPICMLLIYYRTLKSKMDKLEKRNLIESKPANCQ